MHQNAFVYITSGIQGFQQGAQLSQYQQQQPQHIQAPYMHPVGSEQLYQHGIQQPRPDRQQPGYTQPQYGVTHSPPDWQQPGYTQPQYDVQPPPGKQQSGYTQRQHHTQYPPPGLTQPGYPQAQYGNQHPPAGQQYHTNTQLQQPLPSGQFTRERQGILRDK